MTTSVKFQPIILGSDINVYGMARSFHEAYQLHSIAYAGGDLAPTRFSKIVTVHTIKGFDKDPVFIETMRELAKKHNDPETKYLLVPCGDGYAELLAKHKAELQELFVMTANEFELYESLEDKVSFYQICEKYQLPYPKTLIISKELAESGPVSLPFDFPVALKPANSIEWLAVDFPGRKKAFMINSRAEFDDLMKKIYQAGYTDQMIAQDFIPGDDSNMRVLNAYVDRDHNVRMMCLGHPLLEDPAPGAIGNYLAILPESNTQLYQMIKKFLEEIHYVGFANFDLKYDTRDKTFKLFEINLRQGRSSFYVTLNGLNLAKWLVDDLIEQKPFTETVYGDGDMLWLGLPKHLFKEYAADGPAKTRALKLLDSGKWGTTVFYDQDRSFKRWLLMRYMFYNYNKRFKNYFIKK